MIPHDKRIKVKFFKNKIRSYLYDEDDDDDDCDYGCFLLLKTFLKPKEWELCGYIADLESQLENALGGWMGIWNEGRSDGYYIDNFICRYRNVGLVEIEILSE